MTKNTSRALLIPSVVVPARVAYVSQQEQRAILDKLGTFANVVAAQNELNEYQKTKSEHTLRRQRTDVALFDTYLNTGAKESGLLSAQAALHVSCDDLATWQGVNHGLVQGFVNWQLSEGYRTGSINVRLATIRVYCKLAAKAGHIKPDVYTLIKTVEGYRASDARRIDEKRAVTHRPDAKKAEPTEVSIADVSSVLASINASTKKGRRDKLLLALLFEMGLRCGEVALLNVSSLNIEANTIVVYTLKSRKLDPRVTLEMKPATRACAIDYLAGVTNGRPDISPEQVALFPCTKQDAIEAYREIGQEPRIDTSTINYRVYALFKKVSERRVGPHDGRHHMATELARKGYGLEDVKRAGRWETLTMPSQYIIAAKIANAGIDAPDYGLSKE